MPTLRETLEADGWEITVTTFEEAEPFGVTICRTVDGHETCHGSRINEATEEEALATGLPIVAGWAGY